MEESAIPLACDMDAIPVEERDAHGERVRRLFAEEVLDSYPLPDGYTFHFAASAYATLAAFIANERLCCPFFRFVLEVTPHQGPLQLRITGVEGVRDLLESGMAFACSAEDAGAGRSPLSSR